MALFPQTFLDDLKTQTDIVQVISDVVPSLKKTGATWKGLCPFHQEKTPSFNVNRDKGFFNCFGCGTGGDVVKFVELTQKVAFPEAVRYLAQRAGMTIPEGQTGPEDRAAAAEREALVTLHEQAVTFYQEQLANAGRRTGPPELESRDADPGDHSHLPVRLCPRPARAKRFRRSSHRRRCRRLCRSESGLVMDRDGRLVDRFRHRLMIPIARDSGAVVAFGGRTLEASQVPKYLNSPETPLYTKGRTLYGLDVTKGAIRKHNYCVLVEGYSTWRRCGRLGSSRLWLRGHRADGGPGPATETLYDESRPEFDPDAAGKDAAARSSELLVAEGFQMNVALLPDDDPDAFVRKAGGQAYVDSDTALALLYICFVQPRIVRRRICFISFPLSSFEVGRAVSARRLGRGLGHRDMARDEHPAVLHHDFPVDRRLAEQNVADLLVGPAVHHQDVGQLARHQRAELVVHVEDLGVRLRRGHESLGRAEARGHELAQLGEVRRGKGSGTRSPRGRSPRRSSARPLEPTMRNGAAAALLHFSVTYCLAPPRSRRPSTPAPCTRAP